MNDRPSVPLPADVTEALRAERARGGVDASTRLRLRARLHASLLAVDGPRSSDRTDLAPQTAIVPPRRGVWAAIRRVNPALSAALGFVVGATTGVAIYASSTTGVARIAGKRAPVAPPPSAIVERARESTTATPAGSVSRATLPREAGSTMKPATPSPSASTLTAERALLDVAHSALGHGEAAEALSALGRHAQRFPRGVYREEREALIVQSLRALGRADEAQRRASAFEARYPSSLFLSAVKGSTDERP